MDKVPEELKETSFDNNIASRRTGIGIGIGIGTENGKRESEGSGMQFQARFSLFLPTARQPMNDRNNRTTAVSNEAGSQPTKQIRFCFFVGWLRRLRLNLGHISSHPTSNGKTNSGSTRSQRSQRSRRSRPTNNHRPALSSRCPARPFASELTTSPRSH